MACKHAMRKFFLVALLFAIAATPAFAADLDSKDIILRSPYEIGFLAGYGWAMDHHAVQPCIEDAVFMPSLSILLSKKEMGSSFYRGLIQYQAEPVVGVITHPNGKVEAGLSFAGFKYNFTALQSRWSPYSTFGFGGIYEPIGHNVQGSDFNFIIQTGLGVQYFLDDKRAINIQYRYRHISNAHIKDPNWSINSSFLLVGLSFF
jgi:lipid A 3-O-deacylase